MKTATKKPPPGTIACGGFLPWLDWVATPISKQSRLITTPIEGLPPVLSIENTPHVLLTPQLSAIPASELGDAICTLHEHCPAIIGALDFLCTGYERHVLILV